MITQHYQAEHIIIEIAIARALLEDVFLSP